MWVVEERSPSVFFFLKRGVANLTSSIERKRPWESPVEGDQVAVCLNTSP